MKILITSGCTNVQIDKVRAITNIFKGKTGSTLANNFSHEGHEVTLMTSNPRPVDKANENLRLLSYHTYEELAELMQAEIQGGDYDVIIHSAAVSDYHTAGVYYQSEGALVAVDNSKKISSSHPELFLRMVPTEKLVDKIRSDWGFTGTLVKFKLEVGVSMEELCAIASKSRLASQADIIVANRLDDFYDSAMIIDDDGKEDIKRSDLSAKLLKRIGG